MVELNVYKNTDTTSAQDAINADKAAMQAAQGGGQG